MNIDISEKFIKNKYLCIFKYMIRNEHDVNLLLSHENNSYAGFLNISIIVVQKKQKAEYGKSKGKIG